MVIYICARMKLILAINFLFSGFLAALACLAIPVIVHLFNFRKFKKVQFTNVRFLKEIKEETNSSRRLKHLLVLASRMLALAALVLAFAQPFIPVTMANKAAASKAVSIFIDNSFSMDVAGKEGTLLQQATTKAKDIAMAYRPGDRFQLLTNDFAATQQRLLTREEFLEEIQSIKSTTSSRSIKEIYLRQQEALNNAATSDKSSFIISDFQKSTYDLASIKEDSTIQTRLLLLPAQTASNLFVDTAWLANPLVQLNQSAVLKMVLRNSGNKDLENVPVKLFINDIQKSLASVNISAGGTTQAELTFTLNNAGIQRGQISITDFPVTFDDNYFFTFNIASAKKIMAINGRIPSPYLMGVFNSDSSFVFENTSATQVNYGALKNNNLVILNNIQSISSGMAIELKKYVEGGGTLAIFPDSAADISAYNALLTNLRADAITSWSTMPDKVIKLDLQNELFKNMFDRLPDNMDLPTVLSHFEMSKLSSSTHLPLMSMNGNSALLSSYLFGKGKFYFFAVPLNDVNSNFVNHALFAPVMYRMALLVNKQPELSYVIGRDESLSLDNDDIGGEEVFHMLNKKNNFDIIPQHTVNIGDLNIFFSDNIKQAGNYDVVLNNQPITSAAFNYNKTESVLEYWPDEDLKSQIEKYGLKTFSSISNADGKITQIVNEQNEGIHLWKYCILATLLFLGLETLLIRFWKT